MPSLLKSKRKFGNTLGCSSGGLYSPAQWQLRETRGKSLENHVAVVQVFDMLDVVWYSEDSAGIGNSRPLLAVIGDLQHRGTHCQSTRLQYFVLDKSAIPVRSHYLSRFEFR